MEVERLTNRFARKMTSEQLEIYYHRLFHIPEQPFIEIVNHFVDRARAFPAPGDFLDQWYDWQRSHPDKMVKQTEPIEPCEVCHGTGMIEYEMYELDPNDRGKGIWWPNFVCRCGHCENWKISCPKSMKRMKIYQITNNPNMRLKAPVDVIIEPELERNAEALAQRATHNIQDDIPF
jgi:hypothetical protein